MKTEEELQIFICQKAKEHAAAEDEWEYESIEIETFRLIFRFFRANGFVLKDIDYDVLLDGYDEESDKDPDKSQWFYFEKSCEIMDEMLEKNELPPQVQQLYEFWFNSFWKRIE